MKNKKALIIVLVIVMLLPTVIAISNYFIMKNASVSQNGLSQMQMTDLNQTTYTFEKTNATLDVTDIQTNPIKFFLQMNASAQEINSLPDPLKGNEFYRILYKSYGRDVEYKYYFTTDSDYCYFIDNKNHTYKISNDYATIFLNSAYGMSLFANAAIPKMSIAKNGEMAPNEITWKYATGDGVFSTYTNKAEKIDENVYPVSGSMDISFDNTPDSIMLSITNGSDTLYNGPYEDINTVNIEVGTKMTVTIKALWAESQMREYSGEAVYIFNAEYMDKPVFYLGETSVKKGGVVMLTAKNVSDPSTISFSASPEFKYTPIFFQDGSYYRAFIPISINIEHPASYTFTCSADGISQDLVLTVNDRNIKTLSSEESLGSFKTTLTDAFATQTAKKYFEGAFTDPVSDKTAAIGFGHMRPDSNGASLHHEGYDYNADKDGDVTAVNNGVVVFAGDVEGCGKVVVVDHGFGLMTSYVYMSSTSVNVGDEVQKGGKIGTCGFQKYLHLELTVFGEPVDIACLWEKGVITND